MHQRCARLHGVERIGERLEDLVVDPDVSGGLTGMEQCVGHDHREEVGHATGDLAFGDKDRLVWIVEARPRKPGTSAAVNTRTTPGIAAAASVWILTMRARGCSVSTIAPCSIPGTRMSSTNGLSPSVCSAPPCRAID